MKKNVLVFSNEMPNIVRHLALYQIILEVVLDLVSRNGPILGGQKKDVVFAAIVDPGEPPKELVVADEASLFQTLRVHVDDVDKYNGGKG